MGEELLGLLSDDPAGHFSGFAGINGVISIENVVTHLPGPTGSQFQLFFLVFFWCALVQSSTFLLLSGLPGVSR